MKLFKKSSQGKYKIYEICGIKFSHKRTLPSELPLSQRAKKLQSIFKKQVGYDLNLENPQTFNEKIQWLKLFYRNNDMTRVVDKYEFKNYIKEKLGEGYTVPLLGVWDNVNDIDFAKLPPQFVLKCNAQSDGKFIEIVKNKDGLDINSLREEMKHWLVPEETLKTSFCWAYYNVPLKIIAEEYIEQIDSQVYDYKFMCFNGQPQYVLACCNRGENTIYENYDLNWNFFVPTPQHSSTATMSKPKNFNKMLEIATKLAEPFPFVRVDFYEIENKIYVGEMTFYPNGGYNTYYPEWAEKMGKQLKLPDKKV